MKKYFTPRATYAYAFIISCLIIVLAVYFQEAYHLELCPLCIVQRIIFVVLALLFMVGALHTQTRKSRRHYSATILIVALIGMLVAGRHVWLEHNPLLAGAPSCGADILYMFNTLPFRDFFTVLFSGTGECSQETWQFWHLTLPEWSLVYYGFFALIALWQMYRK